MANVLLRIEAEQSAGESSRQCWKHLSATQPGITGPRSRLSVWASSCPTPSNAPDTPLSHEAVSHVTAEGTAGRADARLIPYQTIGRLIPSPSTRCLARACERARQRKAADVSIAVAQEASAVCSGMIWSLTLKRNTTAKPLLQNWNACASRELSNIGLT